MRVFVVLVNENEPYDPGNSYILGNIAWRGQGPAKVEADLYNHPPGNQHSFGHAEVVELEVK